MVISKDYGSYNERRFSKPWIAKITSWPAGKNPVLAFGSYNGDSSGGFTEIAANPGDILKSGQKDYRQSRNTENDFFIVQNDGSLLKTSASEARKAWNTKNDGGVDHDALAMVEEQERLASEKAFMY